MVTITLFDTHSSVKKLMSAGFTEKQAEAQVALQADVFSLYTQEITEQFATKKDLKDFKTRVAHEFAIVRKEILQLDTKFTGKFNMLYWMIGFLLVGEATKLYPLFFS